MKTYFTYKGKRIRIARDSGASDDRYTEKEILSAIESGDAVVEGKFILDTTKTHKIMGVFEPEEKTDIVYEIQHCGHCPLRSAERCYINTVKNVLQNFYDKTMHEECPLSQNSLIIKKK